MSGGGNNGERSRGSTFAPLREPTFRRIWTASLFSSFGHLILGVGAAWEMTRLSNDPGMVALVQSAMMLPLMLVALPAGAMADMFDRRKIALAGLGFTIVSSAALALIAWMGLTTPWLLLAFCMLIGAGVALYAPSWQASIGEQVSEEHLPAAIGLGTISYNLARSFGPAIGGLVVLALGAQAAFGITSLFYVPLWLAFFAWQRRHVPSRLPPERIHRAIASGGRYARHSPAIRAVMTRTFLFAVASSSSAALAPLVAKDLLGGGDKGAGIFGLLLGAGGVGAVLGALLMAEIRHRFSTEGIVRICTMLTTAGLVVTGLSSNLWFTCAALFLIGGCNIILFSQMNVSVQLSAPRWVTARALSLYSAALTGGVAVGSGIWGVVAGHSDVTFAFIASAIAVTATLLLGWLFPLPKGEEEDTSAVELGGEVKVAMGLTMRSGPIIIEVEYDVDPEQAREFYGAVIQLEKLRKKIGGFDWSIARDIANPTLWTERYMCPTWGDYLRMRSRYTQADLDIQEHVDSFNRTIGGRNVHRRLARPYGSVRWKADSPDTYRGPVGYIGP